MSLKFYELDIWKKSSDLVPDVYRVTADYPDSEGYSLVSQTRRSANGVCGNIAEACGRFYFKDKIRVLYQARGEIEELRSHLRIARRLGYISKEDFEYLDKEYAGLVKGLNSYIKSLSRTDGRENKLK